MTIVGRYLGITLIKATLLVLFVLMGLEIFILLATQLSLLGQGSYTLWQAISYVFLILPQQTYLFFPVAGLLGMLFGLSVLANHSELIVMSAAGISPTQIMRQALLAGFVLIIAATLIGELLAPSAKHMAERRKILATSSGQALKTQQGLWLRQGHNFYHIHTIYSARRLAGISRYDFNKQGQLISASYAAYGHFQHDAWQMTNVQQSTIFSDHVTSQIIPAVSWYLALDPQLLKISLSSPDEMSLVQLSEYIHYQKTNHLSATNSQIAFWQRLLQPLSSLVMMFLAIPFIFGPLRSVTTSLRLMLGVMVGFIFYLLNQLFPPLSQVINLPPFIAVLLPILLFALLGYFLLRRVN